MPSRKAVEKAFDDAYDRSLDEPRKMLGGLASYPDEASRLVDGPGYEYFRDQFLRCSDLTGRDRDKIMATMVVHLRPDVKIHFPGVDFGDLTFEKVFGRPFPETSDESRARLGIEGEVDFGKDIKIEKSHIDRGLMYHDGSSGDFDGPEGPR